MRFWKPPGVCRCRKWHFVYIWYVPIRDSIYFGTSWSARCKCKWYPFPLFFYLVQMDFFYFRSLSHFNILFPYNFCNYVSSVRCLVWRISTTYSFYSLSLSPIVWCALELMYIFDWHVYHFNVCTSILSPEKPWDRKPTAKSERKLKIL